MAADAYGLPIDFEITGGEVHDCKIALEFFARLKHFRGIATGYDKLKRNYASMIAMACGFMWLPM